MTSAGSGRRCQAVHFASEGGETGAVEYPGGRVADFFHRQAHATDCLVTAVRAAYVGGLAGAGHGCKRAVEHPDDLAEVDVCRVPGQGVPAAFALSALQDAVVLETEQDELEKLGWDLLHPGEIGDSHRLTSLLVSQTEECLDGVLGLVRQHVRSGSWKD